MDSAESKMCEMAVLGNIQGLFKDFPGFVLSTCGKVEVPQLTHGVQIPGILGNPRLQLLRWTCLPRTLQPAGPLFRIPPNPIFDPGGKRGTQIVHVGFPVSCPVNLDFLGVEILGAFLVRIDNTEQKGHIVLQRIVGGPRAQGKGSTQKGNKYAPVAMVDIRPEANDALLL